MNPNLFPHLSQQVVLITGACGRIGRSLAIQLARTGSSLILVDISSEKLQSLSDELSVINPSSRALTYVSTLYSAIQIDYIIEDSLKYFDKIDSSVHCAYPKSSSFGCSFENLSFDSLSLDITCQLGGTILFAQRVLSYFKSAGGGSLILISSIQGLGAPKFWHYQSTNMHSPIEYTAVKAGLIAITKWLARYFENSSVRVNCVSPGGILDDQPESFVSNYRKSCTNYGLLSSNHVVGVLTFLLSPSSSAINGQNLIVDDGWSL